MTVPLLNCTILNTRPQKQALTLTQELERLGARVINCPAIEIEPLSIQWTKPISSLYKYDVIVFISANAAYYFFLHYAPLAASLPQIFAMGKATAVVLNQFGVTALELAPEGTSESLLQLPQLSHVAQKKMLIVKGLGGRELLKDYLKNQGAEVEEICVYQRVKPAYDEQVLRSIWYNNCIDIILITSAFALENFCSYFEKEAQEWLKNTPYLVISKRLANAAKEKGIKRVFITHPNAITTGIMEALKQLKEDALHDGPNKAEKK